MNLIIEKASGFVHENGTELQISILNNLLGTGNLEEVGKKLAEYQNEDGGWAHGLEIEYRGDISSPMTTAACLGYIYAFGLGESELYTKTIEYLKSTQREDGSWDDVPEQKKFDLPEYMGPGVFVEFKTATILKWLKRLNCSDSGMMDKAYNFIITQFDEVTAKNNFWDASAYIGAIAEYPPVDPTNQKITGWAMNVLMGSNAPQGEVTSLPWDAAQGMLMDDSRALIPMKEAILQAIKENQLEDGSWPNRFGDYYKCWAILFIVRFVNS